MGPLAALECTRHHPERMYAGGKWVLARAGSLALIALSLGCAGCTKHAGATAADLRDTGQADRGRHLIFAYGCGSCHVVPGVPDANGSVGPPLRNFAGRAYIAGALQNTPVNLSRWIMDPQQIEPGTAMPSLGVSAEQARDIASYLHTLR